MAGLKYSAELLPEPTVKAFSIYWSYTILSTFYVLEVNFFTCLRRKTREVVTPTSNSDGFCANIVPVVYAADCSGGG